MLDQLSSRLKKWLNLSWNSDNTSADPYTCINFNKTAWDLYGPIYICPFISQANEKAVTSQAFVAAEVTAYRQYAEPDALATIDRIKTISRTHPSVPFQAVVLAPSYSSKALKLLKHRGITALNFDDIIGENDGKLLIQLMQNLINPTRDPSALYNAAINGNIPGELGSLKGTLFEILIYDIYKKLGYKSIFNEEIKFEDKQFEYDVIAISDSEVLLIECKGRDAISSESPHEIQKHFGDRLQHFNAYCAKNKLHQNLRKRAIFITTGFLTEDCYKVYSGAQKQSDCELINKDRLFDMLHDPKFKKIKKIIDRFYTG